VLKKLLLKNREKVQNVCEFLTPNFPKKKKEVKASRDFSLAA